MSNPALTDDAVVRLIRRILTAPTTSSDTLLAVADGLDDAAIHTANLCAAGQLRAHADNLRRIAPYMAQTTLLLERGA